MIAAREEARIKREAEQNDQEDEKIENPLDELVKQHEIEKKRKAHPSMNWKGNYETIKKQDNSSKDYYAKRRRRIQGKSNEDGYNPKIKSLFQLCVDFLVQHFEYVNSLGPVENSIRNAICEELVAKGKFNGDAFEAIAEEGITALELIDCAHVTQDQLCKALQKLIPAGLQAIILNHSGRCFGTKAVNTIIKAANSNKTSKINDMSDPQSLPDFPFSSGFTTQSSLFALSIGGAYLLKDTDISELIKTYQSSLSSLEFKACPLLGNLFCTSISNCFSSSSNTSVQNGTLLELSLKDLSVSKEDLISLASTDALRNLKNLKLQQINSVDDDVIQALLKATTSSDPNSTNPDKKHCNLEGIDLSENYLLTDAILSDIRMCNCSGHLRSLELSGLQDLTCHGLEAFFTINIPGLPRAPMLRKLNLSSCSYEAITDKVIINAATASSTKINSSTALENTIDDAASANNSKITNMNLSTMGGFVHLNISGAIVSDECMEVLASTCSTSLEELNVSFCNQISDKGLGYLVEKVNDQFNKLHIWGCAQLTDEFLDGHARVESDYPLDIVGAWMKKSGGASMR